MDYYDYYDQSPDELHDDYYYDHAKQEKQSLFQLYNDCMKVSSQQVIKYSIVLLGCTSLNRLLWESFKHVIQTSNEILYNLVSMGCGLLCLWLYVGSGTYLICIHTVNVCIFLWILIRIKSKYLGTLICIYAIGFQLIFEILLEENFESIRGSQMIVTMKLISVAFEIQDNDEKYNAIGLFGYALAPSSVVLGPWLQYRDYKNAQKCTKSKILRQLLKVFASLLLAILFLNISNCIVTWLKSFGDSLWYHTYLDALAIRCSHYFICYLSQSSMLILPSISSKTLLGSAIVRPSEIEFPKSLPCVIRNWNVPMHLWLKKYIFKRIQNARDISYILSIFITYLMSCLVHGLNFRVHFVLFSLSIFSYFESKLRYTLAQIFNACIDAKPCKGVNCKYVYCSNRNSINNFKLWSLLTRLVNCCFSLLVMFQLAYLGVMLNSSGNAFEISLMQTVEVWADLNYVGHLIAIVMAVFNAFI